MHMISARSQIKAYYKPKVLYSIINLVFKSSTKSAVVLNRSFNYIFTITVLQYFFL